MIPTFVPMHRSLFCSAFCSLAMDGHNLLSAGYDVQGMGAFVPNTNL